jgi:hypothetical protein
MSGSFGEFMMAAIGGVISFVIVKTVMATTNVTGWSSLEVTLFSTIVPLLCAVGVIFALFAVFQKMSH